MAQYLLRVIIRHKSSTAGNMVKKKKSADTAWLHNSLDVQYCIRRGRGSRMKLLYQMCLKINVLSVYSLFSQN